jgi:type I restriction enzyme S subunit
MKTIGEVCNIVGGGTPARSKPAYFEGTIPWATIRDLKADWIETTEFSITEEAIKQSASNILPAGTVVVASRVGLGKVCRARRATAINQDLRGFLPKDAMMLDRQYLFYWLRSVAHRIIAAGTGATVQGVTLPFLRSLNIPLPPLDEQLQIVAVLDRAFADIATAATNAAKNLASVRELYESEVNNFTGDVTAVGDLITVRTGKLDANAAVVGGEYPFFTCSRKISAINTYAFDCEAILLAGNNAVGDFNVKHYSGKFNAYQRTYVITINSTDVLAYRYLYIAMKNHLGRFKEQSVGSGTKFLKLGMIKGMKIPLPMLSEQQCIVTKVDALEVEAGRLEKLYSLKIQALADLKRSLLQRAFSGDLMYVPEALAA